MPGARADIRRRPPGPATGTEGVLRGGSWFDPGAVARSSYRFKMVRDARNSNFGFRVAVTVPQRN
jgi:formylglycine-generating enzyme required for sulfatase activity